MKIRSVIFMWSCRETNNKQTKWKRTFPGGGN